MFVALPATAATRDFPFTWTNRTAEAGENGVEAWLTPRIERTPDFVQWDSRIAWVHGVSRTLESQLSLDFDITSRNTGETIDPRVSSLWRWTTWRSEGMPVSFGGQGRVSVGPDLFDAEARLVADLEIGRMLFALNVSGSRSLFWNGRSGVDTRLEENLAVRFQLAPFASFGVEGRARTGWATREYQGTALYVGPSLTISGRSFWVSIGAQAQVAADKGDADKDLEEPLTLRDNERFVLRIAFGATSR